MNDVESKGIGKLPAIFLLSQNFLVWATVTLMSGQGGRKFKLVSSYAEFNGIKNKKKSMKIKFIVIIIIFIMYPYGFSSECQNYEASKIVNAKKNLEY